MYWDRIIDFMLTKDKFRCPHCKTLLGIEILYEKESRRAYRLFQDSVKKKIIKS